MTYDQEVIFRLIIALALGLLVGLERGWQRRGNKEGNRIAGFRTYGLIGLLGGTLAILNQQLSQFILPAGFLGLAIALTTVYVINHRTPDNDIGITSLVSALLTFLFGAMAASGNVALASTCAVLTTLLLSYKPLLHSWVLRLEEQEIKAGLKLLLISVVLLPVLPNQGYGPWQALNPYALWWMVVLIASISFAGYFAVKLVGTHRGILFTALFGGLASSTAITLNFSRDGRRNPSLSPILATGILLACGTMYPRLLIIVTALNPQLFAALWLPALVMAAGTYLPGLVYWRLQQHHRNEPENNLKNPLELKTALMFGILLTLVMLLGKALHHWFGDAGVLVLSAVSGIADVDAISLLLARMSQDELIVKTAATGIIMASAVNSMIKGSIAAFIGGRQIGLRVALPLSLSAVAGLITVW